MKTQTKEENFGESVIPGFFKVIRKFLTVQRTGRCRKYFLPHHPSLSS